MTGNDAFVVLELEADTKFFTGPMPRPTLNPLSPARPWEHTDKPVWGYRFVSGTEPGCRELLAEAKADWPSARYLGVNIAFATVVTTP